MRLARPRGFEIRPAFEQFLTWEGFSAPASQAVKDPYRTKVLKVCRK
jgi:hypothetical protein